MTALLELSNYNMFSLAFVIQDHVSIIDEAEVVRSMFLPSNVFSALKLLDFYLNWSKCNIYFHFLIHAVISLFSFFLSGKYE